MESNEQARGGVVEFFLFLFLLPLLFYCCRPDDTGRGLVPPPPDAMIALLATVGSHTCFGNGACISAARRCDDAHCLPPDTVARGERRATRIIWTQATAPYHVWHALLCVVVAVFVFLSACLKD